MDARTDTPTSTPRDDELIANLLLAAGGERQRLSAVYGWLARPTDPATALMLDAAATSSEGVAT